MFVSFLVVTKNSGRTLEACLKSIKKQNCKKEIIVSDSGSTDNTRNIAKKHGAKVFVTKSGKITEARNLCLRNAKARYLAFVDSDVVLPEGWIEKAVSILREEKDVAGVGGPGIEMDRGIVSRSIGTLLYGNLGKGRREVHTLATMDVVYDREKIKGLEFDERLTGAEDVEFSFRIRKMGYRLLLDASLSVEHHHFTGLAGTMKRCYEYGRVYANPYMIHPEMRNKGFYIRIFYMPSLFVFSTLSLLHTIFLLPVLLQILSLFGAYSYLGIKTCRGKTLLAFPFIHTLKQLSQFFAVFVWLFRRRW